VVGGRFVTVADNAVGVGGGFVGAEPVMSGIGGATVGDDVGIGADVQATTKAATRLSTIIR